MHEVTHKCGHTEMVKQDGSKSIETQDLCFACWKEQQRKMATESAKEAGLQELVGTEKQIEWAETIRYDTVILAKIIPINIKEITNITVAHWWIENKDFLRGDKLGEYIESSIVPAGEKRTEYFVEIKSISNNCFLNFPVKDNTFKNLVEKLNGRWNKRVKAWQINYGYDFVQMGLQLLSAGFPIRITSVALK